MENYKIALAKKNGTAARLYPALVSERIRARYPLDAELALLRQREEKSDEFAAYNAYAEECKCWARAALGLDGEIGGTV